MAYEKFKEDRVVSNVELKALMESYKSRDRDSVLQNLAGVKAEKSATSPAGKKPARTDTAR